MDSLRKEGKRALREIINDKKIVKRIEKKIYDKCCESEDVKSRYSDLLYEKLNHIYFLINNADDETEEETLLVDIERDIDEDKENWECSVYDDYIEKERKQIDTQSTEQKVEKGEFKCKKDKCRSDECYYFQSQTRSADEGATTYVVCSKCGSRYKFN